MLKFEMIFIIYKGEWYFSHILNGLKKIDLVKTD